MLLYNLKIKIDHGIPIVTMKSSAGFTAQSGGQTLTGAFQRVLEELSKKEREAGC